MLEFVAANTHNRDVQELNNAVSRVFQSIQSNPLLNNPTIIKDLVFVSGTDLIVNHQLNRVVTGYVVIKASAAISIYTSSTTLINPTSQIILKSNANATVSILFF